ncbi:hypothetical protein KP509_21G062400 [Ceratopteris richardii]|uniref:VTT domain-containing protein n=1 Tax=Ceratopteris richardii TaxID=49495 RepID=A0A8T2SCF5_CERRI|nr:hypothetical protein KP509_21G062400 [Ceratopteris richardii]
MNLQVSPAGSHVSIYSNLIDYLNTSIRISPSGESRKKRLYEDLSKEFPLPQWKLLAVTAIFASSSGALLLIYLTMPNMDPEVLKIPKDLTDLRFMKEHLSVYARDYTLQVLTGYVAVYVFMQTFMIPGTIFFSLLAGALFGTIKGILLVVFSATAGASACYFLSKTFGAPIAVWLWPQQIHFFRAEVAKRKRRLLNYMLFLRVTPTLPNTFINFASPIVNIPYHIFLLATVFGLVPASFLSVRAGLTLGQLESLSDLYGPKTVVSLFVIGLFIILPATFSRKPQKEGCLS